ncbi:hypothetical protein BDV36DRAFT_247033 [Aspergillus pseudocaelatus]|uniref:Uncharacterized protein n=1 Tax=Aspergillus pseudocaelatus TaxID=1825620 RepID=A0ABQ6WXV0_9EURO|nr:hypothetical protein BDV36DRAFT_247033 [Aspergillus pseudocaelatus]
MKRVMLPSVRCKAIDSTFFFLLFWVADFSGFASISLCSTWFGVLLRKEFFLNIFLPFQEPKYLPLESMTVLLINQSDDSGWPWSSYIIQTDTPGTLIYF